METTRSRFGSVLEWLIAAAFIAAAVAVTAFAVPGFRAVHAVMPVLATDVPPPPAAPDVTAAIPPRAVAVPMLLFVNGRAVHLGDRLSDIAARIGADAQIGDDAVEHAGSHERLTRLYNYVGTRFALVFESLDASGDPRVIGIYRQ